MTIVGFSALAEVGQPVTRAEALTIAHAILLRAEAERNPPAAERRCGTCRWWRARQGKAGLCMWAVSFSIPTWMDGGTELMDADEGTDCDVWEEQYAAQPS